MRSLRVYPKCITAESVMKIRLVVLRGTTDFAPR